MGQNVRVRKLLIGLVSAVAALAIGAVGADFGTAIYAEYRLARTVRTDAGLAWDPSVAILGFPFITQAMRRHYDEVEIRASGVDHPVIGKTSLESTMHSIDLSEASWLVRPDAKLPVGKVESRIIIDSTHVGRFMGIPDLLVEAPSRETNDATGGTTESGISSNKGLVFTGTPKAADYDKKVSVAVDLVHRRARPDHAGLHRDRGAHRCGHRRPAGARGQDGGRAGRVHHHPARTEAALRHRTDQRRRPRLRRHHRGHRRGSNRHAG